MYARIALAALFLWCAGCTQESTNKAAGSGQSPAIHDAKVGMAGASAPGKRLSSSVRHSFASLPDRGDLVGYPSKAVIRHDGAYTWHRADLSEAHALRAIASGIMEITTPSGEALKFRYERHVEHPSGDLTWVGRLQGGQASDEVILTFGEKAVFGSIAQPGQPPLRLTMSDGASWLVETDRAKVASIDNEATRPRKPDYLLPPKASSGWQLYSDGPAATTAAAPVMLSAAATATTVVDVLIGYTAGFAAANNGAPLTRLYNMVETTNQAYINSGIDSRTRLVHAMQVDYPDNTDNGNALEEMTGFKAPSTRTTPAVAFNALRAAREQYGADVVSLVRKFNTPENAGCGIAWLIGGGQSGIASSDEFFAYSVVSDGQDQGTDGKTYFCREETLAHELGHNMGAQHDTEAAKGTNGVLDANEYGVYPYSFGYKTVAGAGNFYTVMAYGDKGQTSYRIFSNPRSTYCGGLSCGVDSQSDNARSLGQTIPKVAAFRGTVAQAPDLYVLAKMGASLSTEVHPLGADSGFQSFTTHLATAIQQTGSDYVWRFLLGDYNRDGYTDLYAIGRLGASGTTEVHVLNGADGFRSFLTHLATALHPTGADNGWVFKLGDYDRDGTLDLYAINRNGASGRTEVHVLNGATNFATFSAHIATALGQTGTDGAWDFALGDYNRDGFADLFVISKLGGSGTTEVHVLDGANAFQTFLLHTATALHQTGSSNVWVFKVGDYNADGVLDLYAINKQGASGKTEVHVLDGARGYLAFSAHVATALDATGSDDAWEFELGSSR